MHVPMNPKVMASTPDTCMGDIEDLGRLAVINLGWF